MKTIYLELLIDTNIPNYKSIAKKIRENSKAVPQNDEDKILHYLNSASTTSIVLTTLCDVFTSEPIDSKYTEICTDGVWEWPRVLNYYVEKYHYRIDKEFFEYMKTCNWKCQILNEN